MNAEGPSHGRVLVVEHELPIRRLLRFTLSEAGYAVDEAEDGKGGLLQAAQGRPDAILLDLELAEVRGLEVLKRLREWCSAPVLMLSEQCAEGIKIACLDAGADDFLTKPFGSGELLARLRALLRRTRPAEDASIARFGLVEVDLARRRVTKAGQIVRLTVKEYALLRLLLTHRDHVLTHRQILSELWGPKAEAQTHYLRVFMMRLRRKLENEPDAPAYLQTEPGVGYRIVTELIA